MSVSRRLGISAATKHRVAIVFVPALVIEMQKLYDLVMIIRPSIKFYYNRVNSLMIVIELYCTFLCVIVKIKKYHQKICYTIVEKALGKD